MMLIGLEPGSRYGQSRDVRNHLSIKFLGSTFDSAETILNIPKLDEQARPKMEGILRADWTFDRRLITENEIRSVFLQLLINYNEMKVGKPKERIRKRSPGKMGRQFAVPTWSA